MRTFIFTLLLYTVGCCHALNCKFDGGLKEDRLKSVYATCLKKQQSKNSSDSSGGSRGGWRGDRGNNPDNPWNKGRGDGLKIGTRDESMSQSEEYEQERPRFDKIRTSTPTSRRYKRERRLEMNSGHRSQYNPNTYQKNTEYGDTDNRNNRSSNDNLTREDVAKSCALHCFLEELEMTGDNGMPDRYLVTNVLTNNVQNEDLKDFLQESIDECFQILYNENTQDKCEFSKSLLTCLSEKGRSNCDDWKDDLQF